MGKIRWTLLSILAAILLGSCQTTGNQSAEMQAYCPTQSDWPTGVSKPKVIKSEPPAGYLRGHPPVLRACLAVRIDEAGNVTDAQVIRTDTSDFGSACAVALMRWKFEPAKKDSTPVAVTYHLFMRSVG